LRSAGIERILLYDIVSERARRLAAQQGLAWVESLQSALCDPGVQAVAVCTPTPAHFQLLKQAFEAGKHAFVEKPLCETAAQARLLLAQSQTTDRKCAVGFIYRFAPAFEKLKELIGSADRQGPLGRPIAATFRIGGRGSHAAWKHRRNEGGGAKREMLVHMLDLSTWLFGSEGRSELLVERLLRPNRLIDGCTIQADAEDYVVARASFGGVEILLQADLVTPAFDQTVSVQGENGTFTGSIRPDLPASLFLQNESVGYQSGKTRFEFPEVDLVHAQMQDFVAAIRIPERSPRCPISESLRVMELLDELM
jgi:predicted dehydrogenase